MKDGFVFFGKEQRKGIKNMSKPFYKMTDSNDGSLFPVNKHWLNVYNFLWCFLGAECSSTGLCCENKVYPLPEFTLPLSVPPIQEIILDPFSSPDPRHPRQILKESVPWCSEQTDDADKAHVGSSRQSFHHALPYESHQRHSGIPLMLILKLPLAILQLFHLFQLPTHRTLYANQRTDLMPALAQHPIIP